VPGLRRGDGGVTAMGAIANRLAVLASAAASAALLAGCASGGPGGSGDGRIVLTTSVAPLADIARNVVGDRAEVVQLIPDGTDSHTYEPSPQNARDLERSDVVVLNGLHLEDPTLDLARANAKAGSRIVLMGDRTIAPTQYRYDVSFPRSGGDPNPHLWMNPVYARRYAAIVRDVMAARDPVGAARYRAGYAAFAARIGRLDAAIRTAVATIPADRRKLVTYHDSFAYFAPRYGMRVVGAVQPADFSEPTPGEVRRIIEQVRREGVPAIFGSEVFPSTVLRQVAAESGARYVDALRDDDLPGAVGSARHTYIGMMVEDVRDVTTALGGDARALDAVPTADPGESR
jgi:ABC-type Zn uptake system ZnuABC Zn-binding protein ZnuA